LRVRVLRGVIVVERQKRLGLGSIGFAERSRYCEGGMGDEPVDGDLYLLFALPRFGLLS